MDYSLFISINLKIKFLLFFCTVTQITLVQNFDLQPIPLTNTGAESCECVPYYLCTKGRLNTDGSDLINIRIDEKECGDYLKVCCGHDRTTVDPITPKPNEFEGCGIRNLDGIGFRINGGHDDEAEFAEFPWMVGVLREEFFEDKNLTLYRYQCGGSLIHPKVVLTAAHCVPLKLKKYKIRAGEWDTQTEGELYKYQQREVVEIITHSHYYAGGFFNDVALLILDEPVDRLPNVDTICLAPHGTIVDPTECFVTGWGKDVYGKEGVYQVILKKIELPIVDRDICEKKLRTTRLGEEYVLHESFICAGGHGRGACKGDGGSPLVCRVPGTDFKYYQAGIVAWGTSCGEDNIPSVYANVPLFVDWIKQKLSKYDFDSSYYTY